MNENIVAAYMGNKYNDVVNPSKNYGVKSAVVGYLCGPALFFFYRSYFVGFIALLCQFISNILLSALPISGTYLNIIYAIAYGYLTYPVYNWDVRRKLNNLISKNPNLSEEELVAIAARKGRNNIIALILYLLVFIAYIAIVIMYIIHSVEQSV